MSEQRHVALVTGGSRGIGQAIIQALDAHGFEVLSPSRSTLDLANPTSVRAFIDANQKAGIDILVNNAGVNVINEIENVKMEDWHGMMQVNLASSFMLAQGFVPGMKKKYWGRIVNISSVLGTLSREKRSAYSATKAGLDGLTRALAIELAEHKILVNSVAPGYIETDLTRKNNSPQMMGELQAQIPMKRLGQPGEIAELIAYLCSEKNTYLTGQTLIVDGGLSIK